MLDSNEIEVETSQILRGKRLKLRTINRAVLPIVLNVFECESPYVMIFLIDIAETYSVRMDVQKEDLARELGLWLEGEMLESPALELSSRGERVMQQFMKYGKTLAQEDLILWILSRSELSLERVDCIKFGVISSDNYVNSTSSYDEMTTRRCTMYIDDDKNILKGMVSTGSFPVSSSHTSFQPKMSMYANTSDCFTRDPFETFKHTRTLLGKSSLLNEFAAGKLRDRAGMKDDQGTRLLRSQLNDLGG